VDLKEETSGNFLLVKEILYDCDADALLIKAEAKSPNLSYRRAFCFYRQLRPGESSQKKTAWKNKLWDHSSESASVDCCMRG
jgi:hypothetical protein